MADTVTTNYGFVQPEIFGSDDTWGNKLNQNWADLDAELFGISTSFNARIGSSDGTDVRNNTQLDARYARRDQNLSDLESAAAARSNLAVLEAGTGGSQARTNTQNDERFVQGQAGTDGTQFRTNAQNDARFLQIANKADQAKAEAGADNDDYMTSLRTAQAIAAQSPSLFGPNPQWVDVSRSINTAYQNDTGCLIQVAISTSRQNAGPSLQVSLDGTNWLTLTETGGSGRSSHYAIIPDGVYYRLPLGNQASNTLWREFRHVE